MPGLDQLGQMQQVHALAMAHAPTGIPSQRLPPPTPQSIPHQKVIEALLERRRRG